MYEDSKYNNTVIPIYVVYFLNPFYLTIIILCIMYLVIKYIFLVFSLINIESKFNTIFSKYFLF